MSWLIIVIQEGEIGSYYFIYTLPLHIKQFFFQKTQKKKVWK
jgi:hypothetical protein